MSEKQPQQAHRMTHKEALNVIFDLKDAYYHLLVKAIDPQEYQESEAFRRHVLDALHVLTRAVYGPCHYPQISWPCEVCRRCLSEHGVQEKGKEPLTTWCCTPCRDQLRAEGKLRDEEEVGV